MEPERIAECRLGLMEFTAEMFKARTGNPMLRNWHQDAICDALERVILGDCPRLIINMPPRAGKTELAVINFMAYAMGMYPDSEFIHASYAKTLAAKNTYEVRALLQNEVYQEIFPWLKLKSDSTAKDHFKTTDGGVVYATGNEGTITGYGAGKVRDGFGGCILVDDPHNTREAESDVVRQSVLTWFQVTMESRKNMPTTPIIVIMQRLHEVDLAGWLLEGGNGEQWEHLVIPAVDEKGKSFWPVKFPPAMLETLEKSSEFVFAGQYMQDPVPRGGGMFKTDKVQIIDEIPLGMRQVRAWDLAATPDPKADWTAGVRMGQTFDGRVVILDVKRDQLGPQDVKLLIHATARADGAGVQGSIPQDPGQAGKVQSVDLIKSLIGYPYAASPESGNKETRAKPLAAQANAGNLYLMKGPWNDEFINELGKFPMGRWDDQVDAASRAFMELTFGDPVFETPPHYLMTENRAIPSHWKRAYGIAVDKGDIYVVWAAEDPADTSLLLYAELMLRGGVAAVQAQAVQARGKWIRGSIAPRSMQSAEEAKQVMAAYTAMGLRLNVVNETPDVQRQQVKAKLHMGLIKAFPTMDLLIGAYQTYRKKDGRVEENPMMQAMLNAITAFGKTGRTEPKPMNTSNATRVAVDPMVGY